jgi:hypothetical protein
MAKLAEKGDGKLLRSHVMFSGRIPRFSGPRLASFAPRVRRNRRRSQVWRFMFSRTYSYT